MPAVDPVIRAGLSVAQPDRAYGRGALDAAVAQFLGPYADRINSGANAGGRPFSTGGGLEWSERGARELALLAQAAQPLGGEWSAVGTLGLGTGRARYDLPRGAGILTDPITIAAKTRFAEADVMLMRPVLPDLPGQIDLGFGAGVRATQSDMHLRSALLDVQSRHREQRGFVQATVAYAPPRTDQVQLFGEARYYGRSKGGLRGGLRLRF
ncbi:MAG: hypothetical protein JJU42_02110 [Rhodobacteraceae bacterium]|nr:hypothetical protein [Paracoccaceae bacterium]